MDVRASSIFEEFGPTGLLTAIEGEDVSLKHPLKEPDHVIPILHDQPILRGVSSEDFETELLVEFP